MAHAIDEKFSVLGETHLEVFARHWREKRARCSPKSENLTKTDVPLVIEAPVEGEVMVMQAACAGAGRARTIRTNSRSVARTRTHQVAWSMELFIKYPVMNKTIVCRAVSLLLVASAVGELSETMPTSLSLNVLPTTCTPVVKADEPLLAKSTPPKRTTTNSVSEFQESSRISCSSRAW